MEDQIVIEIVKKKVLELEKDQKNWVIEGFPKTKVQALSLQKMGVIPDRILDLAVESEVSMNRVLEQLSETGGDQSKDLGTQASERMTEFGLHYKGIREVFGDFMTLIPASPHNPDNIV